VFVRSAYLQIREHRVLDRAEKPLERQDELYEIEDEDADGHPSESGDDLYEFEDD
jgi:hypothetical protein